MSKPTSDELPIFDPMEFGDLTVLHRFNLDLWTHGHIPGYRLKDPNNAMDTAARLKARIDELSGLKIFRTMP